MNKFLITITALWLLGTQAGYGQKIISGTVTESPSGQPLPGVNVVVKDTVSMGTSTDADGNFTLRVPDEKHTLIFSFIGFTPQEIILGTQTTVNVQLEPASQQLSNLVVIGYGTQVERNTTGSISAIHGADLEKVTKNNVQQLLQGRSAGVAVTSSSGVVGEGISVNIRGSSSLSAGNQPLYVIDGIPVVSQSLSSVESPRNNPLASLDTENIESISILKDASAAAIYGSRASNGVVLIKTKSGYSGKTEFDASYQVSTSTPVTKLHFMDAKQYVDFFRRAAVAGGNYDYRVNPGRWSDQQEAVDFYLDAYTTKLNSIASGNDWQGNPDSYDWQDAAFTTGHSQQFRISASGGSEKTTFFVGGNVSDEQGILFDNAFKKISARVNLDHKLNDRLNLGLRVNLNRTANNRLSASSGWNGPLSSFTQSPVTPIYASSNTPAEGSISNKNYNTQTLFPNAIDINENTHRQENTFHTLANAELEYKIYSKLNFKSTIGLDLINQNEERYFAPSLRYFTGSDGTGYNAWTQVQNYVQDNVLSYQNTFAGQHDLEVILGTSLNWVGLSFASISGIDFPSADFKHLQNAATITAGNSRKSDYGFVSYFSRANYTFKDRYLFNISTRIDGSSRFGTNNRYGFFPAASAGWIISDEAFLHDLRTLSILKIRAGYGVTGNADIDDFASLGLYNGVSYAGNSALTPFQVANPDLKWETTRQFDIGLDFGFFDYRINGAIDYYSKNTADLLLAVDVPGTTGFSTQLRNVGKLSNKGLEITLNTDNIVGDFSWTTGFNISFNRNKITDLKGQVLTVNDYANRYVNRGIEGQPIGVFYTNEYAGVNPDNGDALYYLNHEPSASELSSGDAFTVSGRFGERYVTADPNVASRKIVGDPNPDFTGGLSNNFAYKGFSFDVLLQFVYGNDIYNASNTMGPNYRNRIVRQYTDGWKQPGDITDIPEQRLDFDNGGSIKSSRYISDGSFLRVKEVAFSYRLPQKYVSGLNISQVELFVIGTNLLTFSNLGDYEYDPERSLNFSQGSLNIGNSFFSPPQARTISAGINLKF